MRNLKLLIQILVLISFITCKKDEPTLTDNYSSVEDFFLKNQNQLHIYFINNKTGGSFTTSQGTIVSIPPNAFITQSGAAINGDIAISFKDIYKKSEMLLSNLHTLTYYGELLKSAGEFYLKAYYNDSTILQAPEKEISISQPAALTGGLDTINAMQPFILQTADGANGWNNVPFDTNYQSNTYFKLSNEASSYLFSFYNFDNLSKKGIWCNSDNATYFNKYTQTMLSLIPSDSISEFQTQVFLLFNDITTIVHVYGNGSNFSYYWAPQGLKCTLVAFGVHDGTLYSSFVPITITSNEVVNFTLQKTTTDAFKKQLKTLD